MSKLVIYLINKDKSYVPVWFMRQAGRYLPEFRKIRSDNPDFINLCFNSDLASKITLQPIDRYNLDAAIIFSDILLVPYALRQKVNFGKIEGPIIPDFQFNNFINTTKKEFISTLEPVYEAINNAKSFLKKNESLIGFIGAPWTLMIYMFNLKKGTELDKNKVHLYNSNFEHVKNKLIEFLKYHIEYQKKAGADIIQIFDSWAGLINKDKLKDYCYVPNKILVEFCKSQEIPVICFPKGIKENYKTFVDFVKPDCINIDYEIDPLWARNNLKNVCIQGGMNPDILLKDEKIALQEVDKYLSIFKNYSYIFNLGHGILPQTDPEIIRKIVDKIKK